MNPDRRCEVEDCQRPLRARGCCDYHYHRLKYYGAVDALTRREIKYGGVRDDGFVDEVAVRRALTGDSVPLTPSERAEVNRRLGRTA